MQIPFVAFSLLLLVSPTQAAEPFTTKIYPVDRHIFADAIAPANDEPFFFGGPPEPAQPRTKISVLDFFNELIDLPPKSRVDYFPAFGKLVAFTSAVGHESIDAVLDEGCSGDMVSIDFTLVSIPSNVLFASDVFRQSGSLSNREVLRLFRAGHTTVQSQCKVTTLSGINAQIEAVKEIIYPNEFLMNPYVPPPPPPAGVVSPGHSFPGPFETRETGHILNVTPTIAPGKTFINLALIPEAAQLTGWIDYDKAADRQLNPEHKSYLCQPMFRSYNLTTSMVVADGVPDVIGGAPHPKTGELMYGIITARLIEVK